MAQKASKITSLIKGILNDPRKKKSWQSSIGIAIFTLFVLSSVVVNRSVQALNQAAGNYGYYGGSYGYQAAQTTSDAIPNPPTALTSTVTSSSITFSWTAPTQTTDSTSLDNLTGYYYRTGSSSISTVCGSSNDTADCTGSDSTTTSTSLAISSLGCGTTRYIALRSYDGNNNLSSTTLSGSATSATCGGSGGGGGGGGVSGPTYPTGDVAAPTGEAAPAAAVTAPSTLADAAVLTTTLGVERSTAAEQSASTSVNSSGTEFSVTLTETQTQMATNFVAYGYSAATQNLGSGERLALVRDAFDSLQRFPNDPATFFEQVATAQKPTERNIPREVGQLNKVLPLWEELMGRRPNFNNAAEDLAWNTMMYRVRFIPRVLDSERVGIGKFRTTFGRLPSSPLDWATVRAWGYALQ